MIGQPNWFVRRRYSGWGLTPKTWQGWAYILGFIGLTMLAQYLIADAVLKMYVIVGLVLVVLVDALHIMALIKLDEREAKMEAIAERNASWTMVAVLALEVIFTSVMPWIHAIVVTQLITSMLILVLITGMVAKSLTYWVLKNREL